MRKLLQYICGDIGPVAYRLLKLFIPCNYMLTLLTFIAVQLVDLAVFEGNFQ